ncbi:MAG: hypothetical protein FGM57_00460 [Candidatus Taylorbacteria bacterium]|nr:hypothetical protein [Candidatus Taylorbacteria bacterium]
MNKYIAEFIGTSVLSLAVLGTITLDTNIVGTVAAGLTLALLVYSIGRMSGAHVNPAVTLGLWSLKKISKTDALFYILAQFAGAALVLILMKIFNIIIPLQAGSEFGIPFGAELIGALVFTFGIASVVYGSGDEKKVISPFIIGGSLTIGATIASGLGSNGVLNPAVAFALGTFGYAYFLGPIVGAVLGMWLYAYLNCECSGSCAEGCDCPVKDITSAIAGKLKK